MVKNETDKLTAISKQFFSNEIFVHWSESVIAYTECEWGTGRKHRICIASIYLVRLLKTYTIHGINRRRRKIVIIAWTRQFQPFIWFGFQKRAKCMKATNRRVYYITLLICNDVRTHSNDNRSHLWQMYAVCFVVTFYYRNSRRRSFKIAENVFYTARFY